jgi:hypothetical protein
LEKSTFVIALCLLAALVPLAAGGGSEPCLGNQALALVATGQETPICGWCFPGIPGFLVHTQTQDICVKCPFLDASLLLP